MLDHDAPVREESRDDCVAVRCYLCACVPAALLWCCRWKAAAATVPVYSRSVNVKAYKLSADTAAAAAAGHASQLMNRFAWRQAKGMSAGICRAWRHIMMTGLQTALDVSYHTYTLGVHCSVTHPALGVHCSATKPKPGEAVIGAASPQASLQLPALLHLTVLVLVLCFKCRRKGPSRARRAAR